MTHAAEHEGEPVPGLPGQLPAGERILWQGQPDARALARDVFKLHWVAAYFACLCAVHFVVVLSEQRWLDGLGALGLSLMCLGVLELLARLHARSSMYTITTHRVVMRIGVALPVTWNLPFKRLAGAELALRKHGRGDIVLSLMPPDRMSLVQLWPHTEPGRIRNARPCLRGLPEPQRVAAVLAEAVRRSAVAPVSTPAPARNVPRHTHAQTVPRALLWGACGLMLGSIALAAFSGKSQPVRGVATRASQVIELRFEDRPDGALAVLDGSTERELVVLAPGSNNFIRGVLRGMFRVRKLEALSRDVPFRLARDASGKLTLEDRELGRSIALDSFGPDNAAAFRELLAVGVDDAMSTQASSSRVLNGGQHGDYPRP